MMRHLSLAFMMTFAVCFLHAQSAAPSTSPSTSYSAMEQKVWTGKKWTPFGDSLTERNLRTTKAYHDYIADFTGITIQNCGRSGTGYMRCHDTGGAFFQRVSSIDPFTDVITIFGSGNDLNTPKLGDFASFEEALGQVTDKDTTTICGCINHTITLIQQQFPLIPLGIVTPTPWVRSEPSDPGNKMEKYVAAIIEICRLRGVPCLDLYHCSNLHPSQASFREKAYSKDEGNGVHPDETGHRIIAPRFKQFLESLIMF